MPLYETTLEQTYFGQQVINRWNYRADSVPSGQSGAFLLTVAMGAIEDDDTPAFDDTTILGILKSLQSSSAVFVQMVTRNLYSVTDFYTYAFPANTTGDGTATAGMSPTTAYGYASDRTRSDIRRAQKRFVGVTEGNVDAGGVLAAAFLPFGEALGDAMGNPNSVTFEGVTTVFNPAVFGREMYTVPPAKPAYRYYETEAEQMEHIAPITQFTLKSTVRTQTSRQYGRGS